LFSLLFLIGAVVLAASLTFCKPLLSSTDRVTLFIGLLTGAIVWWQGGLITKQMAYSTVLDLYKEWNSAEMLQKRRHGWDEGKEVPNPETIEDVLEFLEKVSTLEKDRYITRRFVWDTFGWYILRYYFYCKNEIQALRTHWAPKSDPTLYQDLEEFYARLLAFEAEERKLKEHEIEDEYQQTRKVFILSEIRKKHDDNRKHPGSTS